MGIFKAMGHGLSALVWRGPKYMVQLFFDSWKVRHILCTEFQKGPACEEGKERMLETRV
jgi:hypothetical protein